MTQTKRSSKVIKVLTLAMWFGSVGCFLYGGVLAVKDLGPRAIIPAIKKMVKGKSAMDPMVLHQMEMDRQKAFEKERAQAKKATKAMGVKSQEEEEAAAGQTDDPYSYIAGGKKGAGAETETLTPALSLEGEGKGEGAKENKSLWDQEKMAKGEFSKFGKEGGAGGAGASGGAGSLGGAGGAGQGIGTRSVSGKLHSAGAQASLGAGAGGGGGSGSKGKMGRTKSFRTRTSNIGKVTGDTATTRLQSAAGKVRTVAQAALKDPEGGQPLYAAVRDAAAGENKSGSILEGINLAAVAGGVAGAAALSGVSNPLSKNKDKLNAPSHSKRSENYDTLMNVLNGLGLLIAGLGFFLATWKPQLDLELIAATKELAVALAMPGGPDPGTAALKMMAIAAAKFHLISVKARLATWWLLWAGGLVALASMAGLISNLSSKSEFAKDLANPYWQMTAMLGVGWGLMAANVSLGGITQMTFVTSGVQSLMKLMRIGGK